MCKNPCLILTNTFKSMNRSRLHMSNINEFNMISRYYKHFNNNSDVLSHSNKINMYIQKQTLQVPCTKLPILHELQLQS